MSSTQTSTARIGAEQCMANKHGSASVGSRRAPHLKGSWLSLRVGSLPDVARLLEPLQTFVQQADSVFFGLAIRAGCLHAWHLLNVKQYINLIESECFAHVALVQLQAEYDNHVDEDTHRCSGRRCGVCLLEVTGPL